MKIKYKIMMTALCTIPVISGCNKEHSYIVISKKNNRIVLSDTESVEKPLHFMNFNNICDGMEYYKYIDIGDTLLMTRKLPVKSKFITHYVWTRNGNMPRVSKINGQTLNIIQKTAMRDSLMREIQKIK